MNDVEEKTAELNRKIGSRLRYARKARGFTQAALGGQIGVTFQQVQKYELGVNRISTATLIQAARILEISPIALLGVDAQDGASGDWTLLGTDDAEALLRAYKQIGSPKLRRIVRDLARSFTDADDEA